MGTALSRLKNVPPGTTETEDFYIIKGVKIYKFPKKPLLTPDQDDSLRQSLRSFSTMFSNFLKKNINFTGDSDTNICTESLSIPLIIFLDPSTLSVKDVDESLQKHEPLKFLALKDPIFTFDDFNRYLKSHNYKIDNTPKGIMYRHYVEDRLLLNSLYRIKEEFNKCNHLQYFIPLVTINVYSKTSHQNLLIINKNDRVVTWIEPQYDPKITPDSAPLILKTINTLLDQLIEDPLLRNDYQIDYPTKICPQAIAEDKNCMFWTFLLAMHLFINNNSTIDEVTQSMLTKFPDKKSLNAYMNDFKVYIKQYDWYKEEDKYDDFGGRRKHRRTIRRKPKNRKRTRKFI